MNIAFDFDGVINGHLEFFRDLMTTFKKNPDNKVLIISGHWESSIESVQTWLESNGVPYDELIVNPTPFGKPGGSIREKGHWKGMTCQAHEVDLMFEDDPDQAVEIRKFSILCAQVSNNPEGSLHKALSLAKGIRSL